MPGITGIIGKTLHDRNLRDLDIMVRSMMHEPFYTSGTYVNSQLGLYAGWVCHKGSFSDCMPVVNETNDVILLFSGENFADKQIVTELEPQCHAYNPSNASYLVHLYEEEGTSFLRRLNGWFCGILVDLRKSHVTLFNDRFGMKRVYFHEEDALFLFSSEAKSLLKVRPELREIDFGSLAQLLTFNCVLNNRTLFPGISLLPNASSWSFRNSNSLKKDQYFRSIDWEHQPVLNDLDFYESLADTFLSVLPRYFKAGDGIAMSLTGGLDTRLIMSSIFQLHLPPSELPCYTFGNMYRDTLDIEIARQVAKTCGQKHYVLRIDDRFFSHFPDFAEKTVYVTDGCLDVCGAHEIYLNHLAREIAPIRLTGNYGSEVLRNNSMLKPQPLCQELFNPDFNRLIEKSVAAYPDLRKGNSLSFAVFKELPWQRYGRLCSASSQLTIRSPYLDNQLVKLLYQAPKGIRSSEQTQLRLITDTTPKLGMMMTNRGTGGQSDYFSSKVFRFLNYFLFKLEYHYLFAPPPLLGRFDSFVQRSHIEKLFLGRQKFEFYRLWFRGELSNYLKAVLLDPRTLNRPYLNRSFLKKILRSHLMGDRNFMHEINKLLTIELIQRLLIENM